MPIGPALVVGFAAEARVARLCGWQVAIGGGTTAGAAHAAQRLIAAGATGIVSFGLAGGLDPTLTAGTLIVAEAVAAYGRVWRTDASLSARLGGTTGHLSLGLDRVIASPAEKRDLSQETGASLVDMESGAVAVVATEARVPFAVLRAICDPADRALPPAALVALDDAGRLGAARLAMSVLVNPGQLAALFGLARDAAAARRALRSRAMRIGPEGIGSKGIGPEGIGSKGIGSKGIGQEGIGQEGILPRGIGSGPVAPTEVRSDGNPIRPQGSAPEESWPNGAWPNGA
jgi:adenosylhomocysteine nucleosidase